MLKQTKFKIAHVKFSSVTILFNLSLVLSWLYSKIYSLYKSKLYSEDENPGCIICPIFNCSYRKNLWNTSSQIQELVNTIIC